MHNLKESIRNNPNGVFASLIKKMIQLEGSDLFIEAGAKIYAKINNDVVPMTDVVLDIEDANNLVYGIMREKERKIFQGNLEVNFAIGLVDTGRVRVNAFMQRETPGLVARIIRSRTIMPEDLNLPDAVVESIKKKRGLILFVGGTGTGKSTSLSSLINYRNKYVGGHIITIEDPIEYIYKNDKAIITQREVGMDTLSFENALKNTLRQAPDVILIGEIRDSATMNHAINFAETGHLCLSTLHANSAFQAIYRIINFFPKDQREQVLSDIANNLVAIVSQRLVPTVDNRRTAAFEVLIGTQRVREQIAKGEHDNLTETMEKSEMDGMMTFDMHLLKLLKDGIISEQTAIEFANKPNDVRLKIKTGAI